MRVSVSVRAQVRCVNKKKSEGAHARAKERERDVQVAVKCPRSVAGYFGFSCFDSAKITSVTCNRHIGMTIMPRFGA